MGANRTSGRDASTPKAPSLRSDFRRLLRAGALPEDPCLRHVALADLRFSGQSPAASGVDVEPHVSAEAVLVQRRSRALAELHARRLVPLEIVAGASST